MAILTHGLPEIRVSTFNLSPRTQADFISTRKCAAKKLDDALSEMMLLALMFPGRQDCSGIVCLSCGAKTDAHGSLPCGH